MEEGETFKVVGVGSSGSAAVERMAGCVGCGLVAVNTDAKTLLDSKAPYKVLIGLSVTGGRSTGNDIRLGERAAVADQDKIKAALEGAKEVFIIAGIGGGTGAGAAPVVAEAAKSMGAVVVAFVNTPFGAEGKVCRANAEAGIRNLVPYCDLIVVVENDRFLKTLQDMSLRDAFTRVNRMVLEAVVGMVKLASDAGMDALKPMLKGYATIGYGVGPTAAKALEAAMDSPLAGVEVGKASGVMLHFTAGSQELSGVQEALGRASEKAAPGAAILWTSTVDDAGNAVEALAIFTGVALGY